MTSPLTLAVVSGKGGVGKSVLSVNLAETFAAAGRRTALVDADFGQSACPVLLNEAPPVTALDVAVGHAEPADALWATASGLTLFQAVRTPGEADAHEPALYDALDIGLDALRSDHDVVLIDAPAGTGPAVRWALDRAGAGLLVLVGEPTAVADAYGLAKLVWARDPRLPAWGGRQLRRYRARGRARGSPVRGGHPAVPRRRPGLPRLGPVRRRRPAVGAAPAAGRARARRHPPRLRRPRRRRRPRPGGLGRRPRRPLAPPMPALVSRLSAAAALAALSLQLLAGAGLEHAVVTAAGVGGAGALALTAVGAAVRHARRHARPEPDPDP